MAHGGLPPGSSDIVSGIRFGLPCGGLDQRPFPIVRLCRAPNAHHRRLTARTQPISRDEGGEWSCRGRRGSLGLPCCQCSLWGLRRLLESCGLSTRFALADSLAGTCHCSPDTDSQRFRAARRAPIRSPYTPFSRPLRILPPRVAGILQPAPIMGFDAFWLDRSKLPSIDLTSPRRAPTLRSLPPAQQLASSVQRFLYTFPGNPIP